MASQERASGELAIRGDSGARIKGYTPLQMFFLLRLERLVEMRQACRTQVTGQKWLADAVSRAIYSTLRDAIEQGVGEEAKAILRREHQAN